MKTKRKASALGYYWEPEKKKFRAQIRIGNRIVKLGRFETETLAHAAFVEAKRAYSQKTESLKPAG